VERLEDLLSAHDLPPKFLWLEITESALVPEVEEAAAKLRQARALGVHVALDDFGTGYSSLALLRDVPADLVKLDASFVGVATGDQRGEALLQGIVDLAHRLGVKVVAEGVESPREFDLVRRIGCDLVQGFKFCPALPEEDERWQQLRGRLQ